VQADTDHLRLLTPTDIRVEQDGVALTYVSPELTETGQIEEEKSRGDTGKEVGKVKAVVVTEEEEMLVTEEASKNVTSMLDDFFNDD
jgi:hypothetical protein